MGKNKLKGRDLSKIDYPSDQSKSMAINLLQRHYKHLSKEEKLKLLTDIKDNAEDYVTHEYLAPLASQFVTRVELKSQPEIELKKETGTYSIFGKKNIEPGAIQQMDKAIQLPISTNAALMPDAHVGYGLPVGGVLATKGAVIPYGVGVDIGCRMCLTLYDVRETFLNRYQYQFKESLKSQTFFGTGVISQITGDHEILERDEFQQLGLLRKLKDKAYRQLGTSGSGNHFVEYGMVQLEDNNQLDLPAGEYLGILSHSGSRGTGAMIANHYTQLAINSCRLPKGSQHLAWLDMNTENGQEYWMAMNLAGDYAKACHDVIHERLAKQMGIKPIAKVENHHNFAWQEEDGSIIHRKGATPAKKGEMGIIPGSMTAPGYIVSGKGNERSLNSAAHGAGRKWSRKRARESTTRSEMNKILKNHKVTLIGGGVDESPMAYKNIEDVIRYQNDLIQVEGMFYPRIVRMDKN